MHIPCAESSDLKIVPFSQAMEESDITRLSEYDHARWLYVPNSYQEYRYILGTRGANPLICIGINPSTARPDDLDNTLKSVSRIAAANGYDSWIMFNVYAQRATDPDDMDIHFNLSLHEENMKAFEYVLGLYAEGNTPTVWAAWGTIIEKRPYLCDCVSDMIEIGRRCGAQWCTAGKISSKGHPHHPLYLKKDEKVRPFDIDAYIDLLKQRPAPKQRQKAAAH